MINLTQNNGFELGSSSTHGFELRSSSIPLHCAQCMLVSYMCAPPHVHQQNGFHIFWTFTDTHPRPSSLYAPEKSKGEELRPGVTYHVTDVTDCSQAGKGCRRYLCWGEFVSKTPRLPSTQLHSELQGVWLRSTPTLNLVVSTSRLPVTSLT